jgi:hypothetical protein
VLPLHLQGRRFWVVGPANDEVVLVDAGDYAQPPTVRLAIAFPHIVTASRVVCVSESAVDRIN